MAYPSNARTLHAAGNYDRILFASITAVDPRAGTVSIAFLDQHGFRDNVPIPVVGMSSNAWIRFVPQPNDVVQVGLRGDDSATILGWHSWAYKARTGGFDKGDINAAGAPGPEMMQLLKPGEIDMRSIGGGYLRFNDIGDVLLMGVSGRLHIWGLDSLVEWAQNAFKVTDGKSWMRFGVPFRFYPLISERELPTTGAGIPAPFPPEIRERDTTIRNRAGEILVHEALGTALDDDGTLQLSGTTGNGAYVVPALGVVGKKAATFVAGGVSYDALKKQVAGQLTGLADQVRDRGKAVIGSTITKVQSVISGLGSTDGLANLAKTLNSLVNGASGLAAAVSGLGHIGREVRYRLHVFKGGQQVFAFDVNEDGGATFTSSDVDGIHMNSAIGSIQLFAKLSYNVLAATIAHFATNIQAQADKDITHTAGGTARRVGGIAVKDNAPTITRTAETTMTDRSGGDITHEADGSYSIQGATVTINGDGSVSITAAGVITVTGTAVLIN